MSEYTPRTGGVRRAYASGRVHRKEKLPMAAKAEFDRWLAEHDRQVAEAAVDYYERQVSAHIEIWGTTVDVEPWPENPYRKDEA